MPPPTPNATKTAPITARLTLAAALLAATPLAAQGSRPDAGALLARFCAGCHGGAEPEADLDLEKLPFLREHAHAVRVLREVGERVRSAAMPPNDAKEQPSDAERKALAEWADARRREALAKLPPSAGRVVVRRLSRFEYEATVEDLFGCGEGAARGIPADDLGQGFDNFGAAASFSLLHFETFLAAAERVAAQVVPDAGDEPRKARYEAEDFDRSRAHAEDRAAFVLLCSSGPIAQRVTLPAAGTYVVRARACGQQAGGEQPRLVVLADGKPLGRFPIKALEGKPQVVEQAVELPAGPCELAIDFENDYWDPKAEDPRDRDRNLLVDWLELEGPRGALAPPPQAAWVLAPDPKAGDPGARARAILAPLLRRAWRGDAPAEALASLVGLVEKRAADGDRFPLALRAAVTAVLCSPRFLFRGEAQPTGGAGAGVQALDEVQLASRLSYFLWSCGPDEELLALAGKGRLRAGLAAQVTRLLADPRAEALARNFAVQWLELRELENVSRDPKAFPGFDRALRADLRREAELLFLTVLREGLPVGDLVTPGFAFRNERLARHYRGPPLTGKPLRRVALEPGEPGGILALGGVLTVTANATRTSPTKRGKWILDNLLDAPPPPPPPGSDSLKGERKIKDSATLREQLALHRKDPACAACHQRMDALGLALEARDPVGRARERDEGGAVDASAVLPDGREVSGLLGLARIVRRDPAFVRCLVKKLFVHAIGRAPALGDELALDRLCAGLDADRATLADLVRGVAGLDAFQKRDV